MSETAEPDSVKPREHHHAFAFVVLSRLALQDPPGMLTSLASSAGEKIVRDLWKAVGEDCDEALPATGIKVKHGRMSADRIAAVVTLPPPLRPGEAHFIAMVAGVDPSTDGADAPGALRDFHYFLLERGKERTNRVHTIIGALRPDAKGNLEHYNFGPGPKPEVEDFLTALVKIFEE